MAAIDKLSENELYSTLDNDKWQYEKVEFARQAVSAFFWTWFHTHQENKVITVSLMKGFIKFPVRVKHLKPLFIQLFGNPS